MKNVIKWLLLFVTIAFIVLVIVSVIEQNGTEIRFVQSGKTFAEVLAEWKDYVIQAKDKSIEFFKLVVEKIKSIFVPA